MDAPTRRQITRERQLAPAFNYTTAAHILRERVAVDLNVRPIILILRRKFNDRHGLGLRELLVRMISEDVSSHVLDELVAIVDEPSEDTASVIGPCEEVFVIWVLNIVV